MMSRIAFFAACAALAAASEMRFDCPAGDAAGCGCCCPGWTLGGSKGAYTCTKGDEECGLCGQTGVKDCGFTLDTCPVPHISFKDKEGNAVPVSTTAPTPAPALFGGAAEETLAPTTPSSGVTLTLGTYNGMDGWLDIPPSSFNGFTGFLLGLAATVPSFYTEAGFTVKYTCDASSFGGSVPVDFVGCDIFFFIYRCPPCSRLSGGIAAQLLSSDSPRWYADNCGPTFKLNRDLGADHQFAVWQAEMAEGTDVEVELMAPAEFIFWAISGKSIICSAQATEADCNANSDNCFWEDGVCRPNGCPISSIYQGPSTPRCQVCVDDEEQYLPEVIFTPPPVPSP